MLVRCSDLTLSRFGKLLTQSRQLFVLGQTLLLHSPVLINELLKALKHLDGRYGILGSPAASPSSVLRALQLVVQVVNLLQHVVRPFHQLVLHTSSTVIREQTANGSWMCARADLLLAKVAQHTGQFLVPLAFVHPNRRWRRALPCWGRLRLLRGQPSR